MRKELFGVFGDRTAFRRFRSPAAFDRVVEGPSVTVGVRDVALGLPGRSSTYADDDGACVLWGEVYLPDGTTTGQAARLLERYREAGTDALADLNGSYLAVVDDAAGPSAAGTSSGAGGALVATDAIRSWECFYTDDPGVRVFGTDPLAVAAHVDAPDIARDPLLEFVHLGVVVGDRTVVDQLRRTPFDSYLTATATHELDRFVYEPREFDYARELADRLERALRRRSVTPGRRGLMLSGGYDSRVLLAGIDRIDECYTVDTRGGMEAAVAGRVADQYGASHRTLPVDERYLTTDHETGKYGHGLSEALHIHHGGYDDLVDVDSIYHGLFFDTFLRGHFLPRDHVEVRGYRYPLARLDPDPDVAETVAEKFGFLPESDDLFPECDGIEHDDSVAFVRDIVERRYDEMAHRYDSVYNGIELFGIRNQPSYPFRNHLADNYVESLVVADAELLDWHLSTPPEHRNTRTFLRALRLLDADLLRHRPPDRPHDSHRLNEIEGFLRRKLPLLPSFGTPWPDRRELYDRSNLDERLFAGYPDVHDLPPRLKLRINDVTTWLDHAADDVTVTPADVLCPPYRFSRDPTAGAAGLEGAAESDVGPVGQD